MKPLYLKGPIDCPGLGDVIHAFRSGELAREDERVVEAHLAACEACARRVEAEAGFDRDLTRRLSREAVPEGLEERLRAALAREGRPASVRRRAWAYGAGLLAASALIAALIVRGAGEEAIVRVTRSATIVDLVCDRHGMTMDLQRACRQPGHVNVLRVEDGDYWGVVATDEASRDLTLSPAHRGRQVIVDGAFYPSIRSIAVDSIRDAALATLLPPAPLPGA